jgi:hypothetical protein
MSSEKLNINDLISDMNRKNSVMVTFYLTKVRSHFSELTACDPAGDLIKDIKLFATQHGIGLVPESEAFNGLFAAHFLDFENFTCSVHDSLSGSPDVTTVQLTLTSGKTALDAWPSMCQLIRSICHRWLAQAYTSNLVDTVLIGTTFVYQGHYCATDQSNKISLDGSILELTNSFDSDENNYCLSRKEIDNHLLFLLNLPRTSQAHPAIIYVYLSDQLNDDVMYNQFFANSNQQLTADAYVFKANYEWQQVHNEVKLLENELGDLFVLSHSSLRAMAKDKNLKLLRMNLIEIATKYNNILSLNGEFKLLGVTISKQLKNLDIKNNNYYQLTGKVDNINQYLANNIKDQYDACMITLSKSEITMEQIRTSSAIMEAQEAKLSGQRTANFQSYLAILGIFLACIQIFDNDSVQSILISAEVKKPIDGKFVFKWYEMILMKVIISSIFTISIFALSGLVLRQKK